MKNSILQYFEKTVSNHGEATAVIEGDKRVSFFELRKSALQESQQISYILNGDCRKIVAVYLDKGIKTIASNLAVLYSGCAFMNLDIRSPAQRIGAILDSVKPSLVITDSNGIKKLESIIHSYSLLNLDDFADNSCVDEHDVFVRLEQTIDVDPMCIINTSGSTGVPKSVILNHRSFIDFTEWSMQESLIGENEIIGSLSPLVFDIYCFELCMLMSKASTVIIIPDGLGAFPARILEILTQHHATFLFWVPTIMVNIANLDLLSPFPLPTVRTVWFAGEVFPTQKFNYWRKMLPKAVFVNLYGPIEITLDCTFYVADKELPENEPVPIGKPCRNTDIIVLGEDNRPVRQGEEGELCVRGTSLAMGYYNNPEATAKAFVQNPLNISYPEIIYRTGDIVYLNEDGDYVFKGRKDTLIKHMGYRIELAEIEHVAVNVLKLVPNCCVVYDNNKKEIIMFYETDIETNALILRKQLGEVLHKHMIPAVYRRVDSLPRNTNGKIDRLKLKNAMDDVSVEVK